LSKRWVSEKLSWSLITGDRKKGQHTDYVKRQYIGNLGKIENGIVAAFAMAH